MYVRVSKHACLFLGSFFLIFVFLYLRERRGERKQQRFVSIVSENDGTKQKKI